MTDLLRCDGCENPVASETWPCRSCQAPTCNRCAHGFLCATCGNNPNLVLAIAARSALERYRELNGGYEDLELARDALQALVIRLG